MELDLFVFDDQISAKIVMIKVVNTLSNPLLSIFEPKIRKSHVMKHDNMDHGKSFCLIVKTNDKPIKRPGIVRELIQVGAEAAVPGVISNRTFPR